MSQELKPKPTEYHGVRLRSKGEAVFARCVSLNNIWWQYEPPSMAVDGWLPDFLVTWQTAKGRVIALIEYKPRKPTDTYLHELAQRIAPLYPDLIHFKLCCFGGLWDKPLGCVVLDADGAWRDWPGMANMLFKHLDEAGKYRFDLKPKPKV